MELERYPQLWNLFCDLISENLTRAALPTLQIILTETLSKIQSAPIQITSINYEENLEEYSNDFSSIQTNLKLFTCAQKGVRLLQSYLERYPPILPTYKIISIVQKFYRSQGKIIRPHWILQPFTDIIFRHKQNLANLLIVTGRLERCCMATKYRDDLVTQCHLPIEHQMIDENTAGIENGQQGNELWKKGVNTLLQMLCEQVPVGTVLSSLIYSQFNTYSSPIHKNNKKSSTTSTSSSSSTTQTPSQNNNQQKPSQMLLEATVLRVKQLINYSEHKMKEIQPHILQSSSLEDIYNNWWGEWHRFGSQFYNFVEQGMIDFEAFVCKVAQNKLRDNGLVWLISQCLMIERLKGYFMKDIKEHNGWLTATILNLHNPTHLEQFIGIRDSSLNCLIYRIWAIFGKDGSRYVVNVITPPSVLDQKPDDLQRRRQWWHNQRSSIDFYKPNDDQISVCLLSNFSSMPIVDELYNFLISSPDFGYLPGNIKFKGKVKPLPIYLLSCLSMKAHQRLLHKIETVLFDHNKSDVAEPPSIIETYVRLLCMAPTANRFKLQFNNRDQNENRLHIYLELINFRLMPLFRFNQATKWLVVDYHEILMKTKHHQLFNSLENFFIKASLYQTHINTFRSAVSVIDFGITANRMFLLSIARTINIHGISDYSSLTEKIPPLFQRLIHLTGPNTWSSSSQYFPDKLKQILQKEIEIFQQSSNYLNQNHFSSASLRYMPIKKSDVDELIQNYRLSSTSTMDQNSAYNQINSRYWLPIILSLKESSFIDLYTNVNKKLVLLSPIDLARITYEFVDFLLDEFIQPIPKSVILLSNTNDNQQSTPGGSLGSSQSSWEPKQLSMDDILKYGSILDEMIWSNNLISFNRFILALSDRDNDPNSYLFIEYFLIHSQHVINHIKKFLNVGISIKSWEEPDFFTKMSYYFQEFPPTQSQFANQQIYPIYYGSFPLRLLPILDCLVMRFFETGNFHLIYKLFKNNFSSNSNNSNNNSNNSNSNNSASENYNYVSLYRYHEAPTTFIKEIFHYYYNCNSLNCFDIKNILLQIAQCNPDVRFSQKVNELRNELFIISNENNNNTNNTNVSDYLNNNPDFYKKFIETIQNYIIVQLHNVTRTNPITSSPEPMSVPFHTFKEFATHSDRILTTCVIEILLFPNELIQHIIGAILYPFKSIHTCNNLSFSMLNTMGLLVASLPNNFHFHFYNQCISEYLFVDQFLFSMNRNFNDEFIPLINPLTLSSYSEQGGCFDSSLSNRTNATITILHCFFYYVSIEVFENFMQYIYNGKFIKTYHHLYILCRLIAPWIYKISRNTDFINNVCLFSFFYVFFMLFITFYLLFRLLVFYLNFYVMLINILLILRNYLMLSVILLKLLLILILFFGFKMLLLTFYII